MTQQLNAAALKEGFLEFNAPRQEGDIDLVDLVRQALINNGVSEDKILECYTNDPVIQEASRQQSHIQRWQLNRYWMRQLVSISTNTTDVRSYLVQDGHVESWLRTFSQSVLPFAIQNGLPVRVYD